MKRTVLCQVYRPLWQRIGGDSVHSRVVDMKGLLHRLEHIRSGHERLKDHLERINFYETVRRSVRPGLHQMLLVHTFLMDTFPCFLAQDHDYADGYEASPVPCILDETLECDYNSETVSDARTAEHFPVR